jgi:hypothetical protein
MVRAACACVVAALVAACSAAQVETLRMRSVAIETVAQTRTCADAITSKPRYADLGTKTHFGRFDTIPDYKLTDARLLTRQDSIALLALYAEAQECRRVMLEGAVRMHPLFVTIFIEGFAASDRIYAEAIFGRITWGQFNEALRRVGLQAQARFERAEAIIAANGQNPDFDNEQRLIAAQAFDQWLNQQRLLAGRQRTIAPTDGGLRSISCKYVGPRLECSSS